VKYCSNKREVFRDLRITGKLVAVNVKGPESRLSANPREAECAHERKNGEFSRLQSTLFSDPSQLHEAYLELAFEISMQEWHLSEHCRKGQVVLREGIML